MLRLMALALLGWTLCVMPVAADESVYDGPTAIKPLTVAPQPPRAAQPNAVCDFEHQCYPVKGGAAAIPAPANPPVVAARPVVPPPVEASSTPDDPLVTAWRSCMAEALQTYEQSHNLKALQAATMDCEAQLSAQGDEANVADTEPRAALVVHPRADGRRDIGCGWWPIGSDADRDCAAGGRRF